jgi:octaprenyl-diphosphate synthase
MTVYGGIRDDLERVEEQLASWSRSENPLTAEASRYVLRRKGKRLRPALVLLTARLFPGADKEAVFLAALVELLHTASLIHDDIVDNAGLRRGLESVHSRWGPNITVLLGDHLYIKSIGLSLRSRHDRITRLLVEVSSRMIEGELEEYALAGNLAVTEAEYLRVAESKTAALFAFCCRAGAILGGAGPGEEERLAAYGLDLGMSFQIVDDVLDIVGEEESLGKPVLSDLGEGRITLPFIHAMGLNGRVGPDRIESLVGRKDITAEERQSLLRSLSACGSLDYAMARAREYSERSLAGLRSFPGSPSREALERLAMSILERDR